MSNPNDIYYLVKKKGSDKVVKTSTKLIVGIFDSINTSGPPGDSGSPGAPGDSGNMGSVGSQGGIGPQGFQGSQGVQGSSGFVGPPGADLVGPTGTQGFSNIIGATGHQGDVGAPGAQGAQGAQGPQGTQGAGEDTYLGLDDTPSTFTANRLIQVNTAGDATSHDNLRTIVSSTSSSVGANNQLVIASDSVTMSGAGNSMVAASTDCTTSISGGCIIASQYISNSSRDFIACNMCDELQSVASYKCGDVSYTSFEGEGCISSRYCYSGFNIASDNTSGKAFSFDNAVISSTNTSVSTSIDSVTISCNDCSSTTSSPNTSLTVSSDNCTVDGGFIYSSRNCTANDRETHIFSSDNCDAASTNNCVIISSKNVYADSTNAVKYNMIISSYGSTGANGSTIISSKNCNDGCHIASINCSTTTSSGISSNRAVGVANQNLNFDGTQNNSSQVTATDMCNCDTTILSFIGASYDCEMTNSNENSVIVSCSECDVIGGTTRKRFILASYDCIISSSSGNGSGFIACSGVTGGNQATNAVSIACSYINTTSNSVRVKALTSQVAAVTLSDERLKKDIIKLQMPKDVLVKLLGLPIYRFHYRKEVSIDSRHTGFLAHEVQEQFPDVVIDKSYEIIPVYQKNDSWYRNEELIEEEDMIDQEEGTQNGSYLDVNPDQKLGIEPVSLNAILWQSLQSLILSDRELTEKAELLLNLV